MPGARLRTRGRVAWSLLLFALLATALVGRASRKEGGVLVRNREFGARFLDGQDPYFDAARGHRIHGPYPPSFVWVAAPLALVPERVARLAWSLAQVLALAVCARLFARRVRSLDPGPDPEDSGTPGTRARPDPRWIPWAFAIGVLLTSRFLLRDTAGGGGNLLFATLAYLGLELYLDRRGALAGLPIGIGLALKPNLAPLLLFFVARRQWRLLASSLATAGLLFALPALWFGPRAWCELGAGWVSDVAAFATLDDLHDPSAVAEGMPRPENGMNQSLREAVFRALRPPGTTGAADVRWTTTSPATALLVGRVLALLLVVAATLRAARLPRPPPASASLAAPGRAAASQLLRAEWFAGLAFFALALLLSPISWKAHAAALLPLAAALAYAALSDRRRRGVLAPVLAGYYFACNLASEELFGRASKHWLQSASIVTWGTLALFALALWLAAAPPAGDSRQRASQAS